MTNINAFRVSSLGFQYYSLAFLNFDPVALKPPTSSRSLKALKPKQSQAPKPEGLQLRIIPEHECYTPAAQKLKTDRHSIRLLWGFRVYSL